MRRIASSALNALRTLVIFVGGYMLVQSWTVLAGLGLHRLGMAISDAMLVSAMMSFLAYIAVVMWAFAHSSLNRSTLLILIVTPIFAILALIAVPETIG